MDGPTQLFTRLTAWCFEESYHAFTTRSLGFVGLSPPSWGRAVHGDMGIFAAVSVRGEMGHGGSWRGAEAWTKHIARKRGVRS